MRNRIVKQQSVKSIDRNSDYWYFMRKRGMPNESYLANPDQVEFPEKPLMPENLRAILEVLNQGGEKILTKRERRAFQLVVREGISERRAALKMHCKQATLQEFVKKACVKLRKLTLSKRCLE